MRTQLQGNILYFHIPQKKKIARSADIPYPSRSEPVANWYDLYDISLTRTCRLVLTPVTYNPVFLRLRVSCRCLLGCWATAWVGAGIAGFDL